MARWHGDRGSLGRTCQAVLLWSLRRVMERFGAGVIIVRTHPTDDEYDTVAVEFGDPAICTAICEEYADLMPDGCRVEEAEDEDDDDD